MLKKPIKTRLCPYSNTVFEAKRQNQVFASAEDRIAHHNEQNNLLRKKLSVINKQLLKNYKIADALLGELTDVSVHREYLKGMGFSFTVFTNLTQNIDELVFGLFDISFMILPDEDYYYLYRTK
jgi:hypothetical protein